MPEYNQVDPAQETFFNEVVSNAFEAIKTDFLKDPTQSRIRIFPDSAEILIYYDPDRDYKWFFYRLQLRKEAVWRKSFRTNQMNEPPAGDNAMLRYDYSITTVDQIIKDFANQYSNNWGTKPLGQIPNG